MLHVERITTAEARPWIMKRHYAHRMPQVQHAFGLFVESACCGVCAFGVPACQANAILGTFPMLELVRLVVDCGNPNAASMLVSRSLKCLPKPLAVVSYADMAAGHVGYIYQATNWIYTGQSRGDVEYIIDGKHTHRKNAYNQFGTGSAAAIRKMGHDVVAIPQGDKHRYYFFLGTKKERREMRAALRYPVLPYPKGDTKRYDASAEIETQALLFADNA